jgi:hypothetical protein
VKLSVISYKRHVEENKGEVDCPVCNGTKIVCFEDSAGNDYECDCKECSATGKVLKTPTEYEYYAAVEDMRKKAEEFCLVPVEIVRLEDVK